MSKTIQIMIDKRGTVTNGDVIKAVFPKAKDWEVEKPEAVSGHYIELGDTIKIFNLDFWNTPYREGDTSE